MARRRQHGGTEAVAEGTSALDDLSWLGLPSMAAAPARGSRATPARFANLVLLAAREVARSRTPSRQREAFQALLVALNQHFPTFYRTRLARDRWVRSLWPKRGGGRLIRLARISRAIVAEFL